MATQVIAVKFRDGETLFDIAEVIWRDDITGKLAPCDSQVLADWIKANKNEIVYVRDFSGKVARVTTLDITNKTILVTTTLTGLDLLLLLPRYT